MKHIVVRYLRKLGICDDLADCHDLQIAWCYELTDNKNLTFRFKEYARLLKL